MTTIKLNALSYEFATEVKEILTDKFKLMRVSNLIANSTLMTVRLTVNEKSKEYKELNYDIEITSSYFAEADVMEHINEYSFAI